MRIDDTISYDVYMVLPSFKGREGTDDSRYDWHLHNGCTFQDSNNLCELHDLGLKPLEARLAIHKEHPAYKKIPKKLNSRVGALWDSNRGRRTVELLRSIRKEREL